jgi:hypothetical protein
LLSALLTTELAQRCGYQGPEEVFTKKVFSKTNWRALGTDYEAPWDLISSVDETQVFIESHLDECRNNSSFKNF